MAFFTLEGLTGNAEVVVFSDLFARVKDLITKDAKVFVIGHISTRGASADSGQNADTIAGNGNHDSGEVLKLLAEDIIPLEDLRKRLAKRINLRLHASRLESDLIHQLRTLSDRHRGPCELWLHVADDSSSENYRQPQTRKIRSSDLRVTPASGFIRELRGLLGRENVWIS